MEEQSNRRSRKIFSEEDGRVWTHAEPIDESSYRSLARLERVAGKDVLAMECRTSGRADEAREWLEGLAGDLLRHKSRKSQNPTAELLSGKKRGPAKPREQSTIPKEMQRQIIHEYLARHYDEWFSTPLPALGGSAPLEAAKDAGLRPKLVHVLRHIEQGEARRAREDGVEPFETSFMWERLGIALDEK